MYHHPVLDRSSLVAQTIRHLLAMRETSVRSLDWEDPPGRGNGSPLRYSRLENPTDTGGWRATGCGVTKSQSGLGPWVAKEWDTAEQLTQCLRGCLRNSHYILGQPQPVDCSHEIKRRLLLGRKAMTNLNSVLKSRDIPLPT